MRPVLFAVGLLALFAAARLAMILAMYHAPSVMTYLVVMGMGLAAAVIWAGIKAADLSGLFGRMASACALGLVFYVVVEPTTLQPVGPQTATLATILRWGDFVALAAAIVAIRRPVFLMLPSIHVIAGRVMAEHVSGLAVSVHDIIYLAEGGIFMGLGAIAYHTLLRSDTSLSDETRASFSRCVAFVAIGFHLANYFWSGIAKVILPGRPLEWLYGNDVSKLLLVAVEKGVAPLATFPQALQVVHDAFAKGGLLGNGFVLGIQLLTIVSLLRLNWMRIFALGYDALHVTVYVVGGILFWPWIWINGAILWALRGETDEGVGWGPKICAAVSILLAGVPHLGYTSWLGWYDVADTRVVEVEAQARGSDKWVRVPISFFGAHAYSVSYTQLDRAEHAGHYSPGIPGIRYSDKTLHNDGKCLPPEPPKKEETAQEREKRLGFFKTFILNRHRDVLASQSTWGKYSYYFRLHHHVSNPLMYGAFHNLDLRDIASYRLVTRSVCLKLEKGKLQRRIVKEDAYVVPVR